MRCSIVVNKSSLIAFIVTVLFVMGLVAFRLLWAGSQVAATAGLGRLPILPQSWQHWIRHWTLDERDTPFGR